MLLCFVFALASVLAVAFVSAQASRANSEALTLAFFIAVLGGFLVLNNLRILINAVMAPTVAQSL